MKERLNQEIAKGNVYPHHASFCLWLLDTELYKALEPDQVERLMDYVGESEHEGINVPKSKWAHLVHTERKKEGKRVHCIQCDVHPQEDYISYWEV